MRSWFAKAETGTLGIGNLPTPRSPIFNEPEFGGDRSYGLTWNSHPQAKIIIFGLPKSGNNWLKAILTDYFKMPGINAFNQTEKRGVAITHLPLSEQILMRTDFIHGAIIIRDMRDLICSFWHYSQTEQFQERQKVFQYDDVESFYYDWFLSLTVPQFRVTTFTQEYAALAVPVIRYEKLWDNTLAEMRKLILRWGLEFDEDRMTAAIKANAIDVLKTTGKQHEIFVAPSHFRKGGYGDYKNALPAKIIADIEARFAEYQRRWGYVD
jgi:hypothetical protein